MFASFISPLQMLVVMTPDVLQPGELVLFPRSKSRFDLLLLVLSFLDFILFDLGTVLFEILEISSTAG